MQKWQTGLSLCSAERVASDSCGGFAGRGPVDIDFGGLWRRTGAGCPGWPASFVGSFGLGVVRKCRGPVRGWQIAGETSEERC